MDGDRRGPLDRVDAWARRRPWLAGALPAVLLAGVLGPVSAELLRAGDLGPGWTAAVATALVALHVAVAFRLRAPVPVFAVLAAAELVLAVAPPVPATDAGGTGGLFSAVLLPSSLAYLVGAYTVTALADRPWPLASLAVGGTGAVVATTRYAAGAAPSGAGPVAGELVLLAGAFTAAVVAAWALGGFRRLHADRLRVLAQRARDAEADRERRDRRAAADERARIARELHDVVAHSVSVMVRQAEAGRYVAGRDPAAAAATLGTIADTGREALTDLRALLGVLRTDDAPAGTDPQPTLDDLPDLVRRLAAAGQEVRLRVEGSPRPLGRSAHLAAYRLVQEALTNVVKHAGPAARADVVVSWAPRSLRLEVADTGAAADGPPAGPAGASGEGGAADASGEGGDGGRGLLGMAERVQLVGGTLRAGPAATGGFRVEAEIPVGGDAARAGRGGGAP